MDKNINPSEFQAVLSLIVVEFAMASPKFLKIVLLKNRSQATFLGSIFECGTKGQKNRKTVPRCSIKNCSNCYAKDQSIGEEELLPRFRRSCFLAGLCAR